jgi:hypothetical protein
MPSSGGMPSSASSSGAGGRPIDPCVASNTCAPGTWVPVTPQSVSLDMGLPCGNYGTKTVQADPDRPAELYTMFMCQGIWKSTDYGLTWSGPINTGSNAAQVTDCAGEISLARGAPGASAPILYLACIRGSGTGFWASTNGGVDWTSYKGPDGSLQQFYPAAVDPHDSQHILVTGHIAALIGESTNGGQTWSTVQMEQGGVMLPMGGTGEIAFIDTGATATTATTWLYLANGGGTPPPNQFGTWRTTSKGGATGWTWVQSNEHVNGTTQIYQPDPRGVVYMAGYYSSDGNGVFRSADYGQTWSHVGADMYEAIVFGTSRFVYAMYGTGSPAPVNLQIAAQPGTATWTPTSTPAEMTLGPAQAAVTNDGTYNIIVTANYNGGLWRYVEPTH